MNTKWILGGWVLLISISSCTEGSWHTAKSGLRYRIVSSHPGDSLVRKGETVKLEVTQMVGDSVMQNSRGKLPLYFTVYPGTQHYNPLEVFDYGIHRGDSIITEQLVDSMVEKKLYTDIPKWVKPTDKWRSYIRVVDVFNNQADVNKDKEWEATKLVSVQIGLGRARI